MPTVRLKQQAAGDFLPRDAIYLADMINSNLAADEGLLQPPVHRLSYDDLHLIFSLCWDPGANTLQIIVSHVCRRWRWYVLEMPDFWSQVHFHQQEPRLSMEKYTTWIQRSKDRPLNISINGESFESSGSQNMEAIMELIGPHMERWRSLQVEQAASEDIRILLGHLKDRGLPRLEHLRLTELSSGPRNFDGRARNPEWESPELFAFKTPRLQNLELVGIVADFDSPLYHNLYTLYLEDEYFYLLEPQAAKDIIHRLLQQSPHLKQLQIDNRRSHVIIEHQNPPLHPSIIGESLNHSSLVDLTLNLAGCMCGAIIPSVKLPALRSFYSGRKSVVTISSWHLPLLAQTSPFPSLKRIDLSGNPNDPLYNIHLPAVLATLESLEELGLVQFDMTQVTNALPTLGYSCPQLREVTIYQCTGVDLNQVRSLVETRIRADGMSELRKIRIFGGVDDAFPELKDKEKWVREHVEHFVLFTEDDWNEYVWHYAVRPIVSMTSFSLSPSPWL